jgi:ferredoxin
MFHRRNSATRFVELNTRNCQACWQCIEKCHKGVIGKIDVFGHRHARILRPDQCAGCLKCVGVCEHGAFQAIPGKSEDGGTDHAIINNSFNKRAFISIAMLMAGVILPVSGIMNHLYQFERLTPQRHFWMSVHNMAGILFLIFAIIHVTLNWRPLVHHVRRTAEIVLSKEAIVAVVLVLAVVGLFAMHAFHVR